MEEREEHIGRGTRIMPGVHIGRYYNNVEQYYENENAVRAIDLKAGQSIRNTSKITGISPCTVIKVKKEFGL